MGKITGIGNLDERYDPTSSLTPVAFVPPPIPNNTMSEIGDKDLKGIVVSKNASGDTYQHTTSRTTGISSKKINE